MLLPYAAFNSVLHLRHRARQDAVLPLGKPVVGADGTLVSEVHVPKGTIVHVGIRQININPVLWGDDAEQWQPERWLKPLPKSLTDGDTKVPGVYSHLMTFLGGPRSCIGFKFSQLEMSKYYFSLSWLLLMHTPQNLFWQWWLLTSRLILLKTYTLK
jgi:cytochrome P450